MIDQINVSGGQLCIHCCSIVTAMERYDTFCVHCNNGYHGETFIASVGTSLVYTGADLSPAGKIYAENLIDAIGEDKLKRMLSVNIREQTIMLASGDTFTFEVHEDSDYSVIDTRVSVLVQLFDSCLAESLHKDKLDRLLVQSIKGKPINYTREGNILTFYCN